MKPIEPITVPLSDVGCKLPRGARRKLGDPFPNVIEFCPFVAWIPKGPIYTARCSAFGKALKKRAADQTYTGDVFRCGPCKKIVGAVLKLVVDGR